MSYLEKLFDTNFMEYASYVIKDRAIPDLEDGLKPVQRRILHTLFEMDDGKFHKVANVVGSTMKYHPHGEASIYDALVVLANKDLFIEKQGNFGNIYTGDEASASRYIECRLLSLAKEILYNPEITQYVDSYDGRNREPVAFPAKVPLVLVQGAEGIAVGMATKILPHNFIEVLQAQAAYLQGKSFKLYPDFPTGGMLDVSDYNDGNGTVRLRAKLDTSDEKSIVIRELPYGTTTASLIDSIESAARKNKVRVGTINDYTAEAVEIEVNLPRGVHTADVVDALYAFTDCQLSINSNLIVIRDRRPEVMSVTAVVKYSTDRLVEVLKNELKIEEGHLRDRLHIRTLEQIFIEQRVYKTIEKVAAGDKINSAIRAGLKPYTKEIRREVTDEDIETLLKIPIRRISLFDINKVKKEMIEIRARLREIKEAQDNIKAYAIGFLKQLIEKHKAHHPRRTVIQSIEKIDVREVARRDLKLRYDRGGGYLGYEVDGEAVLDVSPYDRVLVIRKSGAWSVMDVADKVFVDKGMLYCHFVNKDIIFNTVYRDNKNGFPYLKRCVIDAFILNKGYSLVPEDCTVLVLNIDSTQLVHLEYKPKPRVRILNEQFRITDFPVRGNKARGLRLATREVKDALFTATGENIRTVDAQTSLFPEEKKTAAAKAEAPAAAPAKPAPKPAAKKKVEQPMLPLETKPQPKPPAKADKKKPPKGRKKKT
jgi:topoisomerase-4 subunit A